MELHCKLLKRQGGVFEFLQPIVLLRKNPFQSWRLKTFYSSCQITAFIVTLILLFGKKKSSSILTCRVWFTFSSVAACNLLDCECNLLKSPSSSWKSTQGCFAFLQKTFQELSSPSSDVHQSSSRVLFFLLAPGSSCPLIPQAGTCYQLGALKPVLSSSSVKQLLRR